MLVAAQDLKAAFEIHGRSREVLYRYPISGEFRAGTFDLHATGQLRNGARGGRHDGPDDVPGSGPVEREPTTRLIRAQASIPLDAADGACHPSVHRDLPQAAVTRARTQHPRVGVEGQVADITVR